MLIIIRHYNSNLNLQVLRICYEFSTSENAKMKVSEHLLKRCHFRLMFRIHH